MPINEAEMRNMKKEYGAKEGERVYYAKENKEGKLKQAKPAAEKGVKTKGSAKAALRNTLSKMIKVRYEKSAGKALD